MAREGLPAESSRLADLDGAIQGDRRDAPPRVDLTRRRESITEVLYGHEPAADAGDDELPDDQLRLIFTCCHPALAPDVCAALTLREVCGLTTEEIARAFLTSVPTIAQRIVRAKAKIRDDRIPYRVPEGEELPGRIAAVLAVVYLLFNEGYAVFVGSCAPARRSCPGPGSHPTSAASCSSYVARAGGVPRPVPL